jgi:hypothetical protein
MIGTIIKHVLGFFTGGTLDRVLDTIERRMDDETKKEEIKAEVTKTVVNAQANLMVGRTWWFQLFFVVPSGFWFASVVFDSVFQIEGWDVAKLPAPLDEWIAYIISALFIVDGGKSLIGRFIGTKVAK